MSRRFKRTEVLARLKAQIDRSQSILVVGAGNGLVARCAEDAGADLIVVYNSGYFRLNGHPSMLGNLPIGNANEIMLELGAKSVIPVTRDVPVIGGDVGSTNAVALEKAFEVLNGIFDAVRRVNSDVILLSHGGPLSSIADAELANIKTGAVGFVAASSIERIPIEKALKDACGGFKGIKVADSKARLRA